MRNLSVGGLETFLAIAEAGSLRAAAAALGVQPPAVSQQLKAFEDRIGVSLFTRTTRSVELTDAGRALLRRAQPAVLELNQALEEARGVGNATKGNIRITLPYRAYQLRIASRLAAFQKKYPEIELELSFNEAFVDIVAERFHAGIRLGDRIDEDMIAVRLTPPLKGAYFASPDYLEKHGRPRQPRDLLRHNCIRYRFIGSKRIAEWQFLGPDGMQTVAVKGSLIFNSFQSVVEAALDGLGIGWSLRAGVQDELSAGLLETVLDRYVPVRPGFFLYYPKENARIEILRLFIEFMKAGRS
jgi:DNA-binding transcriptional LysR family regulator